jgi:signal transduction histidine kinase
MLSRIAREAIANAVRHGRARNVVLSLKRTADGMILRISDDGVGFGATSSTSSHGFGLTHMQDRAALLGGSLSVKARRSGGTELELLFN